MSMPGVWPLEKVSHCPNCQKIILTGGQFTGSAEFNIRCPWCQTNIEISIQPKIMTRAVKSSSVDQTAYVDSSPIAKNQSVEGRRDSRVTDGGMRIVGYLYPEEKQTET
jgi:phage FluMu protein Com